jgi:hypothetical protein
MLIVTNFQSFPATWTTAAGESGTSVYAGSRNEFLAHRGNRAALFVVNVNPQLVMAIAAGMLWGRAGP